MISATIIGGIGNQLFIYATARALSLRNNTELALNIHDGFKKDIVFHRKLELDVFHLPYKNEKILVYNYPGGRVIKSISKRLGRNLFAPINIYYQDKTNNTGFDESLIKKPLKNAYLEGYWHSELYFKDFEDQIRRDLCFDFEKSRILQQEEKTIFETNGQTPICIGIRRYEEAPKAADYNLIEKDYYLAAMEYISERVDNPVFYVFTQAKKWAQDNLMNEKYDIRFVADKPENGTVEDLYLMSRFKYHIISNSSFYWWGAWLAKGEIVVSSDHFYNKAANCQGWVIL